MDNDKERHPPLDWDDWGSPEHLRRWNERLNSPEHLALLCRLVNGDRCPHTDGHKPEEPIFTVTRW